MPRKPKQSPETLEQLQARWYKKLKDDGFEDIENTKGDLKVYSSRIHKDRTIEQIQGNQDYYDFARQFLNDYPFENTLDRTIWMYHSEGISVRNIVKFLKQTKVYDSERNDIWRRLDKLRTAMLDMYIHRG